MDSKTITIKDGGHDLKFRLIPMRALTAQKWLLGAGRVLVGAGLLDAPSQGGSLDLAALGKAVSAQGLSGLAGVDVDQVMGLVTDLIRATATRIDGAGALELTATEIDAAFTDIRALWALEKECLMVNFGFFLNGGQSGSQNPAGAAGGDTKPQISLKSLPR